MATEQIFFFLPEVLPADRSAFITGISTGVIQAAVVLIASFIFPFMQNHYNVKSLKRKDRIQRKTKILDDFVGSFGRYIANYMMYAKFCGFLINQNKDTYFGLGKEKGGEMMFKAFGNILEERQPESMLAYIKTYFNDNSIKTYAENLNCLVDRLCQIPFSSETLEKECDCVNNEVKEAYNVLVVAMTKEIQQDIKG